MGTAAAADRFGKSDRFSIRATPREKALIAHAAEVSRMSTSQFVMQAAVRSAEEAIADQNRLVLSAEKWDAFVQALDRPAREIPALVKAIAKSSPFSAR